MSVAEMDRLVADYSTNPSVQALFDATPNFDEAVKAARGAGYAVETEEARGYLTKLSADSQAELSDTQLDAVSGGKKHGPGATIIANNQANAGQGWSAFTNWMGGGGFG